MVLASEPAWSEQGLGPALASMSEPAWSESLPVTPLVVTQLVTALVTA